MAEHRKRSAVWTNFTPLERDKAQCDICGNEYSHKGGSTTNLLRHLAHKHKDSNVIGISKYIKSNDSAPRSSSTASPAKKISRK